MPRLVAPFIPGAWMTVLSLAAGCSSTAVKAPTFSPAAAARAALAEYDANHDGALDAQELAKSPGLLAARAAIDTNGDGKVTEAELVARLKSYQGNRGAVKLFPCRVLLNERPLAGATVTLEPEKFLGPTFASAGGTTLQQGDTVVSADDVKAKGFSGVYCGLYRVRISAKDAAGKELVPDTYNAATTLGLEVPADAEPGKGFVFRLVGSSARR